MNMKSAFILFLLVFCSLIAMAQSNTLSGKVIDSSGEPLIGVSVFIKGTSNGVATSTDGSYNLSNVSPNATVVFTSIGMIPQEVPASGKTTLNVTLVEDILKLEDVVVVGYGTSKLKDLTSPIASIKAEDIAKNTTSNAMQAIQGKVAGVQVISNGSPGDAPKVRIRGIGSFTNEDPLYVVDGMFYDNINFLNNNDIEDISILKDASAAAIYGVRAANGVVLVTTKKGSFDQKAVISYNGYYGIQKASNLLKMASGPQYTELMKERGVTDMIDKSISLFGGSNGVPSTSTDWYNELLRTGNIQNHSLDVTGGTEKAAYTLGFNYTGQEGILNANSDYSRFNIRTKVDIKPYKWLKMGANIIVSQMKQNSVSLGVWFNAYTAPPIIPVYDPSNPLTHPGKYTSFDLFGLNNGVYANPVAGAYYGQNKADIIQVLPSYYAEIDFLGNNKLRFRTSLNQEFNFSTTEGYVPQYYVSTIQNMLKSSLTKTDNKNINYIWDNTLTYTDSFGNHNLTAMFGNSVRDESWKQLWGSAQNIPDKYPEYIYLDQGDADSKLTGDNGTTYRGLSFFGRFTYNYNEKYFLSLTMRADGSSKYQQKWGYFPSIGGAWALTEEEFMKNQEILNYMKLRASWGKLGNDKIPASNGFPAVITGLDQSGVFGGSLYPGFRSEYKFAYLSWENVEETNLGMETGILNNRLKADFDYFNRITNNAVIATPVPTSPDLVNGNWGKIQNRGVELTLNWNDKINKDLSYQIGFNLGTLHNEVLSLKDGVPYVLGNSAEFRTITMPGSPMYSYYGYKVTGVYQTPEQIAKDPIAQKYGLQPGDLMYEDINHDGFIDDKDRQILGSALPSFSYGGNIGLQWKSLDFSLAFMGVSGNQIVNQKRGQRRVDGRMNYEEDFVINRWQGPGTSNEYPSAEGLDRPWNISNFNSFLVESGSFFRIQNIQLGYTFNHIAKKGPNVRVFATAENPWTAFKYNGFTPEVPNGFDTQTYPLASTYSLGLKITY